ncbi:MBL fold metallo-hydrolase [Segetibacter sp. 3557_3]|uniref:MBL fold metallo-hydrolase n=1 Tax=Segetibacter sp. 3557_3 TaxID=2547429 RepID=UPI0010591DBA|nr:MBL fold metallo-hydrolase [Segetibacter sp. 3557_3]TDH23260.1 MBL fold metallo-hydrolase [Segetibacter sp. 3557_3]
MKICPLSEGAFSVDKSKVFVPFEKGTDDIQQRAAGSLLVEVQPFAVVTGRDVLVIDAGLGFSEGGELQIHKNLRANGIEPSTVTKVLMSHLHKDHSGGVSVKDRLGNSRLSFENATYYVQEKELQFALDTGFPSFITDELTILKDHPSVKMIDGDGAINESIRFEVSGGHSPFHQVFWITENNEIAFFGGDVAPQYQQMKSRFAAKYDYDGKRCMELRKEWWEKGQAERWQFMFYHDIKTPVWPHL